MAAKDFKELIEAQQETTKALMSAEEAARYDVILAERKMAFDKKSEAIKTGLEASLESKKTKDEKAGRQQAAAQATNAPKKNAEFMEPVIQSKNQIIEGRLEDAREEQKKLSKTLGGAKKQDKRWQELDTQIKTDEAELTLEGLEGASLLQAQVAIMSNNLGEFATDNAEFNDKKFEADMASNKERRDKATSPAKQKEIDNDRLKLQQEQGGLLGLVASGIIGLRKDFNIADKLKSAGKGIMTLLKGTLIAGFAIAMVAFLNSEYWEKTKKVIVEDIIPKLIEFFGFLKENAAAIGVGFASIVAVLAIVKVLGILKNIKLAFITMQAAMAATKLSLGAALVPMLPIIAIAAAIGVVIFAMKEALSDFQKVMEDGGSITEAFKVGGAKFLGFILGFIPSLITDLVGFVAGLLGFEEVEAKMNAMNPIQFISDIITDMIDGIGNFFSDIGSNLSVIGSNMADMGKNFLKAILQTVLPKPDGDSIIGNILSHAIPKDIYRFAGMNPETGEIIPPDVNDIISPSLKPNALGKVAGKPDFENPMDSRAQQMFDAKLAKTSGQGAPIIISAPSTNVNSNSNSSVSHISTPLSNPNPTVNAVNYSL